MLLQMQLSEAFEGGSTTRGWLFCSLCKEEIGPLDSGEVAGLLSGKYGDPLCFDCEDTQPEKWKMAGEVYKRNLLRLYQVEDIADVPVHAGLCWSDLDITKLLQFRPMVGWCFWKQGQYNQWVLHKVGIGSIEAALVRERYCGVLCEIVA